MAQVTGQVSADDLFFRPRAFFQVTAHLFQTLLNFYNVKFLPKSNIGMGLRPYKTEEKRVRPLTTDDKRVLRVDVFFKRAAV